MRYAEQGHDVTFVSMTNGEAGHHEIGGLELTRRRRAEARAAAEIAGVDYECLNADAAGFDATELVRKLRKETPRIFVGPDHLHDDAVTVNPMCLTDDETQYVTDRIRSYLG